MAKALNVLEHLQGTLVGKIAGAGNLNTKARLSAMLTQADKSIAASYKVIKEQHTKDLKGMVKLEAKATEKIVGDAIGVHVISVGVSENQLAAVVNQKNVLGHSAADWWDAQTPDLQHRFTGAMQQGLLAGEGTDDLIRRVRGTAANGYKDGIMQVPKTNAAAIVRTSAISVSNSARLATFNEMDDVVKGIEWLSTLDQRTTLICQGLDGCTWSLPDYQPMKGTDKSFPGPTAHWGCRSTQIPVLKSWEELAGKKLPSVGDKELEAAVKKKLAAEGMEPERIEKYTARTRASMDGQVSESTDFEGWLKTKPDTFVNDVLGPGRAELWKRGKGVTISQMTDQTNRPITIKQLEANIVSGVGIPETLGVDYFTMDPDGALIPADDQVDAMALAVSGEDDLAAAAAEGIALTKALGRRMTAEQKLVWDEFTPEQQEAVTTRAETVRGQLEK